MNMAKHSSKADSRCGTGFHNPILAKFLPWVFCASLLTGCAHRYDMTLTNGYRVTNVSKPEFHKEEGAFYYKDVTGKVHHVNSGKVVAIDPHSTKNIKPGTVQ